MFRRLLPVFAALIVVASGVGAWAWFTPAPAVYTAGENLALGGWDAVSYQTGHPLRGDARFAARHDGADFRFASAENLAAFQANPDRFAPAYGGYCAWAVSRDYTAPGDPTVWRVVNGRLYLNYNREVARRWQQDIPANIRAADDNWPRVLSN